MAPALIRPALGSLLLALALASWSGTVRAQDYGSTPPPSSSSQPDDFQSGGLTPPPPTDEGSSSEETEAELKLADKEDSGRGLEFVWLNAEAGVEDLGLQTFHANNLIDANTTKSTQVGPVYGAGLGVRLVFLTAGARFRIGTFDKWQLWTLDAELGLHIPLGNLEPYFTLGGGYASVGSFGSNNIGVDLSSAGVSIRGYNIRAGFGIDYYLTPVFSIGANLTGDLLGLTRPGVSLSKLQSATSGTANSAQADAQQVYAADGSSVGSAVTLTAVVGLHF
jgi:hypothetical protein